MDYHSHIQSRNKVRRRGTPWLIFKIGVTLSQFFASTSVIFLTLYISSSTAILDTAVGHQGSRMMCVIAMIHPRHQPQRKRRSMGVSSRLCQQSPPSPSEGEENDQKSTTITTFSSTSTTRSSSSIEKQELKSMKEQAAQLRREAEALQISLQRSKIEKARAETAKIDGWIDDLLIQARFGDDGDKYDDCVGTDVSSSSSSASRSTSISRVSSSASSTELLNTVDQVMERLRDDRYSAEQINKIFRRLCELRPQEARSNLSPMMELLVDAAGKLDCKERQENPNKRWNGRVERVLRKKLFARDWNIELQDEDELDAENPWKM